MIDIVVRENEHVNDEQTRKSLGQVWTPSNTVKLMMDYIEADIWKDPNKTFLDPTMGSGNIILNMLQRRIEEYKIDPVEALKTMYGIEYDIKVLEFAKYRIREYIKQFTDVDIEDILERNFVNHDAKTWCYWGENYGCGCTLCRQYRKKSWIEI